MKVILIGSRALGLILGQKNVRDFKDTDLICDFDTIDHLKSRCLLRDVRDHNDGTKYLFKTDMGPIEALCPEFGSSGALALQHLGNSDSNSRFAIDFSFGTVEVDVVSPTFQFLTKRSHLILPVNWEKHREDLEDLRPLFDEDMIPSWMKEYYRLRRKESLDRARKSPSLMVTKDGFFTDNVGYVYDHDSLHEALKVGARPAYTYLQEGHEVFCKKSLWDSVSEETRLNAVIEEASVIALERSFIPHLFGRTRLVDPQKAYKIALQKICTTLTSGWFRDYAIDKYYRALECYPNLSLLEKFQVGLKNGTIKKLEKSLEISSSETDLST